MGNVTGSTLCGRIIVYIIWSTTKYCQELLGAKSKCTRSAKPTDALPNWSDDLQFFSRVNHNRTHPSRPDTDIPFLTHSLITFSVYAHAQELHRLANARTNFWRIFTNSSGK